MLFSLTQAQNKGHPPLAAESSPSKRSTNINKLIFNIEDDQQNSSQDSHNNLHSSLTKLDRLKRIKGEGGCRMMPSLMASWERDDGYVIEKGKEKEKVKEKERESPQSISNARKNKFKVKHSETMTNFKIFNFEDEELENNQSVTQSKNNKQKEEREFQQSQLQSQLSTSIFINPQQKQKQRLTVSQKPRKPFFDNKIEPIRQKEPQNSSPSPSLPVQKRIKTQQRNANQQQLIFQINEEESSNQQENDQGNQPTDMTTNGQENSTELVYVDAKAVQLTLQLSTKLAQFQDPHNLRIFLSTPVPDGVHFNFQVHKFKNFMQTEYLLWLEYGEQMKLFASATNNTLHLDKSLFTLNIKVIDKDIARTVTEKDVFIGQLVSDFKREVYTLYDHKNYQKPNEQDRVLCTVATVPNFINPKQKSQQLYIPRVSNKKAAIIHNNSLTKNLKKLYKIAKFYEDVERYTTHGVALKVIEKMREEFKVVTNTSRNALVKDQGHQAKILFLKMQQNRFKVRVGPGLTPIQVLSYAAVHLE